MPESEYDMSPEELYEKGDCPATDWQNYAYQCATDVDELGEDLTPWEIKFIADVIDGKPEHISRPMHDKLTQILGERVGRT